MGLESQRVAMQLEAIVCVRLFTGHYFPQFHLRIFRFELWLNNCFVCLLSGRLSTAHFVIEALLRRGYKSLNYRHQWWWWWNAESKITNKITSCYIINKLVVSPFVYPILPHFSSILG